MGQVIPPLEIVKRVQLAVPMTPTMTTQPNIRERDMFGTKARSAVWPLSGSPISSKVDGLCPYLADWKWPMLEKFLFEVAENTIE